MPAHSHSRPPPGQHRHRRPQPCRTNSAMSRTTNHRANSHVLVLPSAPPNARVSLTLMALPAMLYDILAVLTSSRVQQKRSDDYPSANHPRSPHEASASQSQPAWLQPSPASPPVKDQGQSDRIGGFSRKTPRWHLTSTAARAESWLGLHPPRSTSLAIASKHTSHLLTGTHHAPLRHLQPRAVPLCAPRVDLRPPCPPGCAACRGADGCEVSRKPRAEESQVQEEPERATCRESEDWERYERYSADGSSQP